MLLSADTNLSNTDACVASVSTDQMVQTKPSFYSVPAGSIHNSGLLYVESFLNLALVLDLLNISCLLSSPYTGFGPLLRPKESSHHLQTLPFWKQWHNSSDRYAWYFTGQTPANRIPCCAKENNVFRSTKIQSITGAIKAQKEGGKKKHLPVFHIRGRRKMTELCPQKGHEPWVQSRTQSKNPWALWLWNTNPLQPPPCQG